MPKLLELLQAGNLKDFKKEYYALPYKRSEKPSDEREKAVAELAIGGFNPLHAYAIAGDSWAISGYSGSFNSIAPVTRRSPLHYAADFGTLFQLEISDHSATFIDPSVYFLGYKTCINILVEHGANPRVQDAAGKSALRYVLDSAIKLKISPKMASECAKKVLDVDMELWEEFTDYHVQVFEIISQENKLPKIVLIGTTLSEKASAFVKAHKDTFITSAVEFFTDFPKPGTDFLDKWVARIDLVPAPQSNELKKFQSELKVRLYLEQHDYKKLGEQLITDADSYPIFMQVVGDFFPAKDVDAYKFLLSIIRAMLEYVSSDHKFSQVAISGKEYTAPPVVQELLNIVKASDQSDKDKLILIRDKITAFQAGSQRNPKIFKLSFGDDQNILHLCKQITELIYKNDSLRKGCTIS
jgi:hypothetical protein